MKRLEEKLRSGLETMFLGCVGQDEAAEAEEKLAEILRAYQKILHEVEGLEAQCAEVHAASLKLNLSVAGK